MANFQKHGRGSIGHLGRHFERKTVDGKHIRYNNTEIKTELSYLNYNLAPDRGMSVSEFIEKRTGEVKCLKRKDVKVMCTWVVTLPRTINNEKEERQFFQESYNFLEKTYKQENIVSSFVHKDEKQPHMHFAFVPVVQDRKKKILKVSAKECVTRKDLQQFHEKLSKHMEKIFGRDIGILNQATREGNKAIDELKRKSAVKRVNEVNEKTKTLIENTHQELKILKAELENLKLEYEAKNEYIKQINKSCEISKMLPSYAKVKDKGILNRQSYVTIPLEKWEKKFVSANEIESIEKMKQVIESKISKIRESDLYKTGRKLKKEIENLNEKNRVLFNELSSSKKALSDIEKALEKNPDLKEQVKKALKSYKSNRNRGRSR
jgi:hypothetical protein